MTDCPLISIVLPTYNGSRYLDQSVQSCLDQTYTHWELIIVDDASTDDTPQRIAQYVARDRRIRAIRHPTNRKLPAALNTGFAHARGEYLTWTSDDNLYCAEALARMLHFLESHPTVDIVYSDYTLIDETGQTLRSVAVQERDWLLRGNYVGPCFLYRRKVQEKVGDYAQDLFLAEDYEFWLRASMFFEMRPLHENLYLYRLHSASLSTTMGKRQIEIGTGKALIRHLPQLAWADTVAKCKTYMILAKKAFRRRDWGMGGEHLWQAMRCSPAAFVRLSLGQLYQSLKKACSKHSTWRIHIMT